MEIIELGAVGESPVLLTRDEFAALVRDLGQKHREHRAPDGDEREDARGRIQRS
jgi:hypothetical protein